MIFDSPGVFLLNGPMSNDPIKKTLGRIMLPICLMGVSDPISDDCAGHEDLQDLRGERFRGESGRREHRARQQRMDRQIMFHGSARDV